MAIDYTEAKATLDEIANKSNAARARIERARAQLVQAEADLTAMATQYGPFVQELDAIANGQSDTIWSHAKGEKDAMVSDFNVLQSRAQALLTAYDSVE